MLDTETRARSPAGLRAHQPPAGPSIDENGGWDGPDGGNTTPESRRSSAERWRADGLLGQLLASTPSNADTSLSARQGLAHVYRRPFALRTTAAAKAGLCFKIHNLTDSSEYPDRWFCYTAGDATWSAGDDYDFVSTSPLTSAWRYIDEDIYDDVRNDGDFGTTKDDFQVIAIRVESNSASTPVDLPRRLRFESADTNKLDESNLSWTSGSGQTSLARAPRYFVGSQQFESTRLRHQSHLQDLERLLGAGEGGMWAYPSSLVLEEDWRRDRGMVFYSTTSARARTATVPIAR